MVYKLIKTEGIKARNDELRVRAVSLPTGKYAVILADPPWQYSNSGFNESAESQYPTMPTDKIFIDDHAPNLFIRLAYASAIGIMSVAWNWPSAPLRHSVSPKPDTSLRRVRPGA